MQTVFTLKFDLLSSTEVTLLSVGRKFIEKAYLQLFTALKDGETRREHFDVLFMELHSIKNAAPD